MSTYAATIETETGAYTALVDEDGALTRLLFSGQPVPAGVVWSDARCAHVATQLREYLAGERTTFDLALRPAGSPFQQRVWAALRALGYGETVGYGELAARLGEAGARAVGRANATNPIPIVVPCHRVVGANGTLTGYAGGVPLKTALLRLEGVSVRDGEMPRLA